MILFLSKGREGNETGNWVGREKIDGIAEQRSSVAIMNSVD